ncbi:helicase [Paenibacillus darwinianus]|uniref:Helicase n=1 Tax=Paenibacillus darwinianus TaxID=1380763 RepID=A0A9W5W7W4_9BACL|nr:RNA polymerase recycling motor HelD [Paenibacillus darwinianus]EXX90366.1 helicase [Paenibacillus darwinianus]EXX91014.1 helicase [Paenibacillus darwinianus]EXX91037.1 helicase [Paenibacillus darwinianus]
MNETDSIWTEEQSRVSRVVASVAQRIEALEMEIGNVRSEAVEIRKHFWDEITVNFSSSDDVTETYFSMKQQADLLAERERTQRHSAGYLNKLRRLAGSPYFGRIDFRGEGEAQGEPIYLGIASYREEDADMFLVYDWRAPVSSLYYDYPPGPAVYATPAGEVKGELQLKRQFVIREGRIRYLFDTGITIGDQLLQQMLSRTSDSQMKSIVATIQQEQNRIIRNDRSRMLVVQGAAGSGKTSAALQRVAYLLYRYRGVLAADQMVLFSPNPMFNSYVASVLPELGEENMIQTTFQAYLENRLGKEFRLEDSFDQLEYVLSGEHSAAYEARLQAIRFKSSAAYLQAVQAYLDSLLTEGMLFRPIKFNGKTIVSGREISSRFYGMEAGIRLANRITLIREWLTERVNAFEATQMNESWVEEAMQLLDQEAYQRAYYQLRERQKRKTDSFDDFDAEKELFAAMIVRNAFKPIRRRIKLLRFIDVKGLYRQLFADPARFESLAAGGAGLPPLWKEIASRTVEQLDDGRLSYEDMTPYLYVNERLKGFRANTSVRHVLIDEAQDYTPFQLEFLKWLFPRSRMTALGDLNQAIYAQTSAMAESDPLTRLYGADDTEWIRLTKSYRSTREIVLFTRGMVAGGEQIEPFNRSGNLPVFVTVPDTKRLHERLKEAIQSLTAEGFDSIAVICRTAAESKEAFEALEESVELKLVTKDTPQFDKGVCVIPAYLAKGVEFDAVLIYDASEQTYGNENERKLFYTACTRAMHELYLFSVGEASRFVTAQPADTYRREA